ncbi:MAG: PQQ-dependent sugar dehydrogenase [Anaerolineae bacterium]
MAATPTVGLGQRHVDARAVEVRAGYAIEPLITGLNYPTSVAWDADGCLLVAESRVPFGRVADTEVRVLRFPGDGPPETVVGPLPHLVNDIAVHEELLYLSLQGRIAVAEGGRLRDLITDLPSWGLHENNALAFGPDERLYFAQGSVSNAGVIDAYTIERLQRNGRWGERDIPGQDVVLTGVNYDSSDGGGRETRRTGAFVPWGRETVPGERVEGARVGQAASGAIMSAKLDGSDLRVFAWGFRNPFGLAFAPNGRLYVANNGANRVPPRPIHADPDAIWAVDEGGWYGWPDFYAGYAVTESVFSPPAAPPNAFLIANHRELLRGRERPPQPVVGLGLHVSPCKFDFCRSPAFGSMGQAFVPEFGAILSAPERLVPQPTVGRRVVQVDVDNGTVADLAVNRDRLPASQTGSGGLERPIQARFGPDGALYVVDFGPLELTEQGWEAPAGGGVIWRMHRTLPVP